MSAPIIRHSRWRAALTASVLCLAIAMPVRAAAPEADFEQTLAQADRHANAGRHADALRTYAAAFGAMPDNLRVSGVAEFIALAAGRAAIADYQERGEAQALERGQAVLVRFIDRVLAEPSAEGSADAAQALLAKIEAMVPPAPPRAPQPETHDEPAPEREREPARAGAEPRDRGKINAMGKTGIGLMVAGGLTTIGGVVLVALPPSGFPEGDPNANKVTTTRPAGAAVLGGGAALVIVGAVLLGVERTRAKRQRTSTAGSSMLRATRATVHPWLRAHAGGLGVTGYF